MPKNVAVIGGGYIGVELGGMLRAFGSNVTLVAMEDRILERFDDMIGDVLEREMREQGIAIETGFTVRELQLHGGDRVVIGADGRRLDGFDTVIWAVGRRANTAGLAELDPPCSCSSPWSLAATLDSYFAVRGVIIQCKNTRAGW